MEQSPKTGFTVVLIWLRYQHVFVTQGNIFHVTDTTVFSQIYVQRKIILDLRKIGSVLQTECDFPWHYTRFENERWPEEGDGLPTGGAGITARIWFLMEFSIVSA